MKRLIVVLMAIGLFGAMPVLAAEHGDMGMDKMDMHDGMTMDTSDGARECALQAESIQQKMKRLESEIKKGSTKYSAAELKRLEEKLKEANDTLDILMKR